MAGGVLALDLATHLGWAFGRLPARPLTPIAAAIAKPPKPISGAHRIAPPGCPVGRFLSAYEKWLGDTIDTHTPSGIIFEAPILPQKTTPDTVRKLVGLAAVTQMMAFRAGISWVREAPPSRVKKHFCGSGAPGKEGVKEACRARGWTFSTDDEADALALHDYAASLFLRERSAA